MEIKRIGPKSLAKQTGLLYAIFGLITGAFMSLFAILGEDGSGMGIVFGVGAIVCVPILYGVGGLVGGYVTAWVYNFLSRRVGGIEIETE